jgi:hypothetical protein
MRLKGSKAVKIQDQCLMPRHGLLVVSGEVDLLLSDRRSFSHVADIARAEGVDRIESMGRFEIAATDQETESIGRGTQARGDLLDRYRKVEVALALHTVEHRR